MAPSLLVASFKAMVVSATANWQACEGTHILNRHSRHRPIQTWVDYIGINMKNVLIHTYTYIQVN